MSKKRKIIGSIGALLLLCSCNKEVVSDSETGHTTSTDFGTEIKMNVSATSSKINIDITGGESSLSGKDLKVVSLPAYQYLKGDDTSGLINSFVDVDDATLVGKYSIGTNTKTLSIDRTGSRETEVYDQEKGDFVKETLSFDNLYNKYYIVNKEEIVLGPIYCTEIESINTAEPVLNTTTKKGLMGEDVKTFKDLGCSYATLNLEISNLIMPNEYYFDGEKIGLDHSKDEISFVSNGKTFYFNPEVVAQYDSLISSYYDAGAAVTAIIVASPTTDEQKFPTSMTYEYSTKGTKVMALNSGNELGFEYFVAMMEFLSNRYTEGSFEHGFITNFVIGNEIDYAADYNRISEKAVSLDVYMEEYSRLLRLTDLAGRKYYKDIRAIMPTTQYWAKNSYNSSSSNVGSYAPKKMVDWLNERSKKTGNFNWGLAPHCYGYHLAQSYVFAIDTSNKYLGVLEGGRKVGQTGNVNTSSIITFSNLELLDMYFKQDSMLFNGKTRGIYLLESGVSNCYGTEEETKAQAGYIAAIWYKVSQLSSIVSWNYYRVFDNEVEMVSEARFGLKDENGKKKPAYEVYKYIDTQYSENVASPYLESLEYFDADGKSHSVKSGNASSYLDFLDVFNTGYDFSSFSWTKAKPRTVDTVYEFEDKEDLGNLTFLSKSYLYDGEEKSLAVINLPEGMTVSYEGNDKTEVGEYKVLATISKNGEVVGRREATLTINSHISIGKNVYNYGEDIVIDSKSSTTGSKDWIGIFHSDANIGNSKNMYDTSFYYYYPDKGDGYTRSTLLQQKEYFNRVDYEDNKTLEPGEYKICYLLNDGYDIAEEIDITILDEDETTNTPDLTGISFTDTNKELTSSSVSLEIEGILPTGVTVEYKNNTLTEEGKTNAVAIFNYQGVEIARRYAVLTVVKYTDVSLFTDKTSYTEGESVMVTAKGDETQWVGIYAKGDDYGTDASIYWYYVKDHLNEAVDIKTTNHNANRSEYYGLPAGEYVIVLFKDSGYTVQETVAITVVADPSAPKNRITTNKTSYVVGDSVEVSLRIKSEYDWVGLFTGDCTEYGDSTLLCYYSPKTEGQSINNLTVDMSKKYNFKAGSYKIVAFATGDYSSPYEECTITVTEK